MPMEYCNNTMMDFIKMLLSLPIEYYHLVVCEVSSISVEK